MVKDGTRRDAFKKPAVSVSLMHLLLSSLSMGYSNIHIYLLFQQLPGSCTCKTFEFPVGSEVRFITFIKAAFHCEFTGQKAWEGLFLKGGLIAWIYQRGEHYAFFAAPLSTKIARCWISLEVPYLLKEFMKYPSIQSQSSYYPFPIHRLDFVSFMAAFEFLDWSCSFLSVPVCKCPPSSLLEHLGH